MTDIDLEAAINYVRPVAESATVGMYGTMLKTVLDAATRLREAEAEADRRIERYKRANPKRAVTKLREAEAVIEEALMRTHPEDEIIRPILSRYKTTKTEGGEP